jgi:hypothetical protein
VATTLNLPAGASYDVEAGVGGRVTYTQSVSGWRFPLNARHRVNADGITFENCTFEVPSDYSIDNRAFVFAGTGGIHWRMVNCTLDGNNHASTLITRCIGNDTGSPTAAPSLIDKCKVLNWPGDWISGIRGVAGQQTIIRDNFVRVTGAAGSASYHPDGIQLSEWGLGDGLVVTGNVIDVRPLPGNTDFSTAPIAMANTADFSADVSIADNILIGGSHSLYCTGDGSGAATGEMSIVRNYVTDYVNGILYAGAKVMDSLAMNNIKNANTGAALTFSYNNGSSTNTVSSIP